MAHTAARAASAKQSSSLQTPQPAGPRTLVKAAVGIAPARAAVQSAGLAQRDRPGQERLQQRSCSRVAEHHAGHGLAGTARPLNAECAGCAARARASAAHSPAGGRRTRGRRGPQAAAEAIWFCPMNTATASGAMPGVMSCTRQGEVRWLTWPGSRWSRVLAAWHTVLPLPLPAMQH